MVNLRKFIFKAYAWLYLGCVLFVIIVNGASARYSGVTKPTWQAVIWWSMMALSLIVLAVSQIYCRRIATLFLSLLTAFLCLGILFELRVANFRADSLTTLFWGMIIIALAIPAIGWKELK